MHLLTAANNTSFGTLQRTSSGKRGQASQFSWKMATPDTVGSGREHRPAERRVAQHDHPERYPEHGRRRGKRNLETEACICGYPNYLLFMAAGKDMPGESRMDKVPCGGARAERAASIITNMLDKFNNRKMLRVAYEKTTYRGQVSSMLIHNPGERIIGSSRIFGIWLSRAGSVSPNKCRVGDEGAAGKSKQQAVWVFARSIVRQASGLVVTTLRRWRGMPYC